jgi:hypothetical protein
MILMFSGTETDTERMSLPSDMEVRTVVHEWFRDKSGKFFPHRIHLLIHSWRKHVQYNGDCTED